MAVTRGYPPVYDDWNEINDLGRSGQDASTIGTRVTEVPDILW